MIELRLPTSICLWMVFSSCVFHNEDGIEVAHGESDREKIDNNVTLSPKIKENSLILLKIHSQFPKPVDSYPIVESSTTAYQKNGLLYRIGFDQPFTGLVKEVSDGGILMMQCTFLNGMPHGKMNRFAPDGNILMEALFVQGVLSGTRTKWWENGQLKEEEYWGDGEYQGRTNWDNSGRLIKREVVPKS